MPAAAAMAVLAGQMQMLIPAYQYSVQAQLFGDAETALAALSLMSKSGVEDGEGVGVGVGVGVGDGGGGVGSRSNSGTSSNNNNNNNNSNGNSNASDASSVDNKGVMLNLFKRQGLSIANGGNATTSMEAALANNPYLLPVFLASNNNNNNNNSSNTASSSSSSPSTSTSTSSSPRSPAALKYSLVHQVVAAMKRIRATLPLLTRPELESFSFVADDSNGPSASSPRALAPHPLIIQMTSLASDDMTLVRKTVTVCVADFWFFLGSPFFKLLQRPELKLSATHLRLLAVFFLRRHNIDCTSATAAANANAGAGVGGNMRNGGDGSGGGGNGSNSNNSNNSNSVNSSLDSTSSSITTMGGRATAANGNCTGNAQAAIAAATQSMEPLAHPYVVGKPPMPPMPFLAVSAT